MAQKEEERQSRKRLDHMSTPLMSDAHLQLVQEGVHHMFHVLRDIVVPLDPGGTLPQKELLDRLKKMETEKWERIRTGILESKGHDYNKGGFTAEESKTPIKVIYDMMTIMSDIKSTIEKPLQEHFDTEEKLRGEIKKIQANLAETQSELADLRWNYKKDKANMNTLSATVHHLEEVIREKSEKIAELQRENNVQLWQKEKERVLAKANERQKELEEEVKKITRERDGLSKKFSTADNELRMQKLKLELSMNKKTDNEECTGDLTKAKQHIYVLEKDMRSYENELFNQQKYMIGLLKGLKEEYCDTWNEVLTQETVPLETCRLGRQFQLRLNKIFLAAAEGRVGAIRADLPDQYLATDKDIARVPVKKLSLGYGAKLAPLPEDGNRSTCINLSPQSDGKPVENNNKRRSTLLPEGTLQGFTRAGRRRSSVLPDAVTQESTNTPNEEVEHPTLVNERTGFVNMIAVMKFFPYMTQDYVRDQWGHFKTYDTNGDGELDLSELMNAMTNTVGGQFTAAQVREAMLEVDIDGSQTMDFFEYLSIAHLLSEKKGRSDVFRSKLAREEGRHVSKTCVVQ